MNNDKKTQHVGELNSYLRHAEQQVAQGNSRDTNIGFSTRSFVENYSLLHQSKTMGSYTKETTYYSNSNAQGANSNANNGPSSSSNGQLFGPKM